MTLLNKKMLKISIFAISLILIVTISNTTVNAMEIDETDKYYLDYNILEFMKDGLEDPVVAKFYQKDIEDVRTITYSKSIEIKYFDVDLNDDGLTDKIVTISSPLHSGSGGDSFRILINNGDSYVNSCNLTLRMYPQSKDDLLYQLNGKPAYVRILKSKKNGFHSLEIFISDAMYQLENKNGKSEYVKISSREVIFRLEYENGRYKYVK